MMPKNLHALQIRRSFALIGRWEFDEKIPQSGLRSIGITAKA